MVNINLYIKNTGSYKIGADTVHVTKDEYKENELFEKVEYRIVYYQTFSSGSSRSSSRSSYNVYIIPKRGHYHIFEYTTKFSKDIVRKVESYHSKKHTNFPLILGFKGDDPSEFRYYSFKYLKDKIRYTGLPSDGSFGTDELNQKLKEENNKVNKIEYTSRENPKSQICKKEEENLYFPITKRDYYLDDKNRYEPHVLTKKTLFEHEKNNNINDLFISVSFSDDISVYYYRQNNLTIFVEFKDDSGKKRQYLRRDEDGYYWTEQTIANRDRSGFSHRLELEYKQIFNKIGYMLNNNDGQYGRKNIIVTPEQQSPNQHILYKHKTDGIHSITKTFVLYNRRAITLIDNDKFRGGEKLRSDTIQNSKFTEVTTYSLSTSQSEHLLIKLTRDTNTHYYLKRYSEDGIQWKQVSIDEIKVSPFIAASGEGSITDQNLETLLINPEVTKKLLDWISFQLKGSLVILLNKKGDENYTDDVIEEALGTLKPKKDFNAFKLNDKKITVSDKTSIDGKCISPYNYKVLVHDLDEVTKETPDYLDIRFLIPSSKGKNKYQELKLFSNSDVTGPRDYLRYQKGQNKVYVVFYQGTDTGSSSQGDPRPLLLCYDGNVYKPKGKEQYDQTWVKVDGVEKCLCPQNTEGAANGQLEKLLGAVTGVVGFLNTVNLWHHPGQSTSTEAESQACTNDHTSGVSGATQCQTDSDATTCTYPVHTYNGQPIQVQVTCSQVNGTTGSTCYRKLTHTPIGTSGKDVTNGAKGFRLGDVEYCPNSLGSGRTGKIDYYGNGEPGQRNGNLASNQNKWKPLVAVSAYFYDADKDYKDPLLVVLEFAKVTPGNGDSAQDNKECYRLKSDSGSLAWEKDGTAKKLVDGDGEQLASYLDGIRYCLKKVVKVELQHNGTNGSNYKLEGRDANSTSGGAGTFDKSIDSGQTQVNVQVVECPKLTNSNYKCVRHELTEALAKYHHEVAGLAFTLPGQDDKVIEIPLDQNGGKGSEVTCTTGQTGTIPPVLYNKCMGDVFVYFYVGTKTDESTSGDPRPGLVCLNNEAYRPLQLPEHQEGHYTYTGNVDCTNWVRANSITKCGCENEEDDKIIKLLTEIYFGSSIMKFLHEHVTELSGGGGGLLCLVGSIVGGILVFKKVTAASAAAAVAAAAATAAAM